jgi:hypothetical protein
LDFTWLQKVKNNKELKRFFRKKSCFYRRFLVLVNTKNLLYMHKWIMIKISNQTLAIIKEIG